MTPARPPGRLALAATLAALCAAPAARAEAGPIPVALARRDGHVVAAVDLTAVLPGELPSRLGNGLRNVVALYVAVVPIGGEEPTAAFVRVFDVLFDVWEETWTVTVRDPRTPGGRRHVLRSVDALRALLARVDEADLGPAGSLPPSRFTVDVRIDVNPISPELLAATREYLAGAAGGRGASRSVLGAVAGFLLREPEEREQSLVFRSRPLSPDAVPPR
ncbi:MAG TPA: hypothetical protein VLT47_04975 [Anaeromyxobacteraceae bacterium]|nr:hypothetical protein [Anaeromyxobacteraceae bacterium]